jgi:hypothetical protein
MPEMATKRKRGTPHLDALLAWLAQRTKRKKPAPAALRKWVPDEKRQDLRALLVALVERSPPYPEVGDFVLLEKDVGTRTTRGDWTVIGRSGGPGLFVVAAAPASSSRVLRVEPREDWKEYPAGADLDDFIAARVREAREQGQTTPLDAWLEAPRREKPPAKAPKKGGAYVDALLAKLGEYPKARKPFEAAKRWAAAEKRADLRSLFEVLAERDWRALSVGTYTLHTGIPVPKRGMVERAQRDLTAQRSDVICIGTSKEGDLYVVAAPGKTSSRVMRISRTDGSERQAAENLDDLLRSCVGEARRRGEKTTLDGWL